MATAQSIRDNLEQLDRAILELRTLADISMDLAGEDEKAPQWPWLVSENADRVFKAAQELETAIRRHALPIMEDMQRLTKA